MIAQNEVQAAIETAVQALPPDQRTVFVLAEYEDISYRDIAKVLECSPKAVEMHLYRARQMLRKHLQHFL